MARQIDKTTTLTFSDLASRATFVTDPSKPSWNDYLTKGSPKPESGNDAEHQERPVKSR